MSTEAANIIEKQNRLIVSGDLNFSTVPFLWEKSLSLMTIVADLQFDFANVTSSNSAGLALLIEWFKYGKTARKKVMFDNVPAQLQSIMDAAGVKGLFI